MKHGFRISIVGTLSICLALFVTLPAHGTSLVKMNVADLTALGSLIVVGEVVSLSDGFDVNNLPYTEVTVDVSQSLKGYASGEYTFRQFGLLAPRDVGNGRTYVGVSPDGWPRFQIGQEVLLFLYETTSLGFQSTVGLLQGKFDLTDGEAMNAINNESLFKDVSPDPNMLSEAEQKMLTVERGPVPADTFIDFVSKAVANHWFE